MLRALIVDDEQRVLVSIKYGFQWERQGVDQIITTTNPLVAREFLETQKIDVVFIDICMPGLSSFDMIHYCQENNIESEFVILTKYSDFNRGSFDYTRQAIQLHVFDCCIKPIQIEKMVDLLERLSNRLFEKRLEKDDQYYKSLLKDKEGEGILEYYGLRLTCSYYVVIEVTSSSRAALMAPVPGCTSEITFLVTAFRAIKIIGASKECILDLERYYERCENIDCVVISQSIKDIHMISRCLNNMKWYAEQHMVGHNGKVVKLSLADMADINHTFIELYNYIEDHYCEKLSLQDLSRRFNLNYTYCCELFKKTVSINFSQYITKRRLEYACVLLKKTDLSVTAISYQIGYNSYNYFANVFRKRYGMTPSQYREEYWEEKHGENHVTMNI